MLEWAWADERLRASRNYWVCTTRADGRAHAAPVWGIWHEGAVVFGTDPKSVKGRNIARDPRAVVHLESGDEVVILEGTIERVQVDDAIADAYEEKYGMRAMDTGGEAFTLRASFALAWTESDYPNTATRFDWD